MELLLTYDVDTGTPEGRRRLRSVARICEAHGQRVQKSVFEVVITEPQYLRLLAQLESVVSDLDSLRIYRVPAGTLASTTSLRRSTHLEEGTPWVL